MISDPIADAITKVRNAYRAGHTRVVLNHSNIIEAIVILLAKENFINSFHILEKDEERGLNFKKLSLNLRYTNTGQPVLTGIDRVSKPGRRVYVKASDVPRVFNNTGCAFISTSSGVMVDRDARNKNVGGEYICKVW